MSDDTVLYVGGPLDGRVRRRVGKAWPLYVASDGHRVPVETGPAHYTLTERDGERVYVHATESKPKAPSTRRPRASAARS